jgi:hypothetical protein
MLFILPEESTTPEKISKSFRFCFESALEPIKGRSTDVIVAKNTFRHCFSLGVRKKISCHEIQRTEHRFRGVVYA